MPAMDKTGPLGTGPLGRGRGGCQSADSVVQTPIGQGRGQGRGNCCGRGYGRGQGSLLPAEEKAMLERQILEAQARLEALK